MRISDWSSDVCSSDLSFNGISQKALAATQSARCARSYLDWRNLLTDGRQTAFAGTAAVHLWFGLQEAVRMIREEGSDAIFARHRRLAEATRRAIRAWRAGGGPELYAADPPVASDSVSAALMPDGPDAAAVRRICIDRVHVPTGGGMARSSEDRRGG